MTRYYFHIFKESLYGRKLLFFLVLSCLYFSLTMNFSMSPDVWVLVQLQNTFFYIFIFFPLYGLLFYPIFLTKNSFLLIRAITKKRYITAKVLNITLFNSLIFGSIFLIIKFISIVYMNNDVSFDPGQNIELFQADILRIFNDYRQSAIAILIYASVGFSFMVSLLVIFRELVGKTVAYVFYIMMYALIVWSTRPGFFDFFSNDKYEVFKINTYIILPVTTIAEQDISLVNYFVVKWAILFLLLGIILFIYVTRNNFGKYTFFDKLFISPKIVLSAVLFVVGYLSLFYIYSSDIIELFSLYSYGYFFPPQLIWLMTYFLFIPFVLSIRFSQLSEGINFLVIRCHTLKFWRRTCLITVLKYVGIHLSILMIVLSIFINLSGVTMDGLLFKSIILNFLEIIFITITYLLIYFQSSSTIMSFLFCLCGYLVITLPLSFVKWLPFALSSVIRADDIGYNLVIMMFIGMILIEVYAIIYSTKMSIKFGRIENIE
ncbi:hypothetical protein [Enterococcus sp. RIT-PI-f]|uniref:hypothetical protein n=1 Tax=Enterococcus sp. RIT-PI-f TaxID=1690244 RepID=UPI0006B99614|nr:hypothetical protein [Enterococcus sp. RIT-PI-f]KPG70871.1 hypothetical protein AEQ18_06745 [Enterococcus sp. RIT-PI-f]